MSSRASEDPGDPANENENAGYANAWEEEPREKDYSDPAAVSSPAAASKPRRRLDAGGPRPRGVVARSVDFGGMSSRAAAALPRAPPPRRPSSALERYRARRGAVANIRTRDPTEYFDADPGVRDDHDPLAAFDRPSGSGSRAASSGDWRGAVGDILQGAERLRASIEALGADGGAAGERRAGERRAGERRAGAADSGRTKTRTAARTTTTRTTTTRTTTVGSARAACWTFGLGPRTFGRAAGGGRPPAGTPPSNDASNEASNGVARPSNEASASAASSRRFVGAPPPPPPPPAARAGRGTAARFGPPRRSGFPNDTTRGSPKKTPPRSSRTRARTAVTSSASLRASSASASLRADLLDARRGAAGSGGFFRRSTPASRSSEGGNTVYALKSAANDAGGTARPASAAPVSFSFRSTREGGLSATVRSAEDEEDEAALRRARTLRRLEARRKELFPTRR